MQVVPDLMRESDIDEVVEIERLSFSSPWSRECFADELQSNDRAFYVVMREGERVVGYAGMWAIVDEAHVTNIAIHPDSRGRGLGRALMLTLMKAAAGLGLRRMTLEVRVSNHIAQALYRSLGFVAAGVRRGYYEDNREDALVMWVPSIGDAVNDLEQEGKSLGLA